MYAYLLDAEPDVLLYAGPGVWVVRLAFLTPTRRAEVGFVFMPRVHALKDAASPD
jgi:hypothetical protein